MPPVSNRPSEISHYRIVEHIGSGGMGEVYLAEDVRLHRRVALKLLPHDVLTAADHEARFKLEARTASALNHPNIVTIYEIDEVDGYHFIAQELVSGRTIRELLEDGPLTVPQAVEVAIGIASALVAAHEAGIVHRDIKPDNVMVRKDGLVKVLDFGLAKLLPDRASSQDGATTDRFSTEPGSVMGTFNYMSPEQILTFDVDQRSDVFSLGMLIYEMLTGEAPFNRTTRGDTVKAILFDSPAPIASFRDDVPELLLSIVRESMAKERDDRIQSTAEVLDRLLDVRNEIGLDSARNGSSLASRMGVVSGEIRRRPVNVSSSGGRSVFGVGGLIRERRPEMIVATLLLAAALVFVRYLSGIPRPVESIAIVPFESVSDDSRIDYLSVGLTEEITQRLSQISSLRVLARSTMDEYRDSTMSAVEIGRQLGVDAIITGSVMAGPSELQVGIDVVDVRLGTQIWGNVYRRGLSDLFLVQESISRDIANELRLRLSGEEESRVSRRFTESSEAYDEYLKGRYAWVANGRRNCEQAIKYFRRAIELDPGFANAYVGLADCYNIMGSYAEVPPEGAFPAAREYANKALRLDGSLAAAHIALAYTLQNYDWDWEEAQREYLRAFDLEPSHATGRYWYGGFLMILGRFDEAIEQRNLAHTLDPLSIVIRTGQGSPHMLARDYNAAIAHYKRAISIDPTFAQAHRSLGWAYLFKGELEEEAIQEFLTAERLSGGDPDESADLAYAFARAGRQARAREILANLSDRAERYVSPYDLALIHVGLGESDQAFALLEKAVRQRSSRVTALKVDPALDPIRDDPRYEALLWKTGLHAVPTR